MYLSDLVLSNFRSYQQLVLKFSPGVTTFIGENGQGKTNIVESIGYLATLGSHRVASDQALIRQGSDAAVVQGRVMHGESPTTIEVEVFAGRANRARLNRGQVRPPEILGTLRAVTFAPEDLELVRGEPGVRRDFLDSMMIQIRPRLAGVKTEYDKVLRQRTALLKAAGAAKRRGGSIDLGSLDVWDIQLARLGGQLTAARAAIVSGLRPHVEEYYRLVSGGRGVARIDYRASVSRGVFDLPTAAEISADDTASARVEAHEEELLDPELNEVRFLAALAESRAREIDRGVNLVGPHRDELVLSLATLPAKGYASHGESWSYALALRLAAWRYLCEDESGEWSLDGRPVLILDDVFAELDARRRTRLAELVSEAEQVFVTAAVGDDLPEELAGARFFVNDGSVEVDGE